MSKEAIQAVSSLFIGPRELSSSGGHDGDVVQTAEEIEKELEHMEHE